MNAALLALSALLPADSPPSGAGRTVVVGHVESLAQLQGKWFIVSAENNGKLDVFTRRIPFVVKGDCIPIPFHCCSCHPELRIRLLGDRYCRTFNLDYYQRPGELLGTCLGICELQGDVLRVCFVMPNLDVRDSPAEHERPKDFRARGERVVSLVLKRVP
jgi:uncharacterized protein (TIGR03067 family)